MKLTTSAVALLCLSSTSAFVAPTGRLEHPSAAILSRSFTAAHAAASSSSPDDSQTLPSRGNAASSIIAATSLVAFSPLAALAEQATEEDYVYGAVNAPGGIGLAAVLGVLAILTAAVPVILAPGEDAFNEMKERDEKKWRK